jgi:hypothetical protein
MNHAEWSEALRVVLERATPRYRGRLWPLFEEFSESLTSLAEQQAHDDPCVQGREAPPVEHRD